MDLETHVSFIQSVKIAFYSMKMCVHACMHACMCMCVWNKLLICCVHVYSTLVAAGTSLFGFVFLKYS